jgi:uncharacterized protein (DUF885 family)
MATSGFRQLAKGILRSTWDFHPTYAASSGLHAHDGRLPDYSTKAAARRLEQIDRQLRSLDRFASRKLSPRERVELGVLKGMLLSDRFDLADQRQHRTLPAYALFRLSIVNYLMRNYAPLDRRLRAVAALQEQLPRYLTQIRATLERRLADTCYEMGDMAARGIADAFERELPPVAAKASARVRSLLERTNSVAVLEMRAFHADLESRYKPHVKRAFALGRAKYDRMTYAEHLARIPTDRLLQVGHADLEANRAAFHETATRIDASKTPMEVLDDISRDHPKAETLIDDTKAMLEEIRQFVIDHDVVRVPSEERAQVIETPRFYRFATAAMNPPGSFERVAKEAYYYVTPVEEDWPPEKQEEWLRHLNYTSLRNISVHECYPGHYVHLLHRKRVKSTVLRSYFSYAFTEGWAHYCEEMLVDEGFGDLRLRLAQLQDALLRDCRYVSSIMMHTRGWSWEDATKFFMENAYLDRLPAEREAKRGTWDPGYLNYTLGKLMIKRLRADYLREKPGATLREFHDALLALGAPPLGLAREGLLGARAGPPL